MGNHFIEKIQNIELNKVDEFRKIKCLFEKHFYPDNLSKSISIKDMFSANFLYYPNRGSYIDPDSFIAILEPKIVLEVVNERGSCHEKIDEDKFIIYLEFLLDVVNYFKTHTNIDKLEIYEYSIGVKLIELCEILYQQIVLIVEKLNYKVIIQENVSYIIKKEQEIKIDFANLKDRTVINEMYDYLKIENKNNEIRKREILSYIASNLEGIKNSFPDQSIYKDLTCFYNQFHIRHNNESEETSKNNVIAKMSSKEKIEIYDFIFEYSLFAYNIYSKKNFKDKIEKYKKKYKLT